MECSGWRNDSALRSTCCSSRVPAFWLLAPMLGDSKQPARPALGLPGTSLGLCWHLPAHVHKWNKSFNKVNFAVRDVCSSVVEHSLSWGQALGFSPPPPPPRPLQEIHQLWWKLKKPVDPIQQPLHTFPCGWEGNIYFLVFMRKVPSPESKE